MLSICSLNKKHKYRIFLLIEPFNLGSKRNLYKTKGSKTAIVKKQKMIFAHLNFQDSKYAIMSRNKIILNLYKITHNLTE